MFELDLFFANVFFENHSLVDGTDLLPLTFSALGFIVPQDVMGEPWFLLVSWCSAPSLRMGWSVQCPFMVGDVLTKASSCTPSHATRGVLELPTCFIIRKALVGARIIVLVEYSFPPWINMGLPCCNPPLLFRCDGSTFSIIDKVHNHPPLTFLVFNFPFTSFYCIRMSRPTHIPVSPFSPAFVDNNVHSTIRSTTTVVSSVPGVTTTSVENNVVSVPPRSLPLMLPSPAVPRHCQGCIHFAK